MSLSRRGFLTGTLAALAAVVAGPVAPAPAAAPVAASAAHPLFAGEIRHIFGVKWIHPIDLLVEPGHDARTWNRLDEGWATRRIVWAQRWPRGIP